MLAYLRKLCVFLFSHLWNECTRQYLFQQDWKLFAVMTPFTNGFPWSTGEDDFTVSESNISPPLHTMQSCSLVGVLFLSNHFQLAIKFAPFISLAVDGLICLKFSSFFISTPFVMESGNSPLFYGKVYFSPNPNVLDQHVTCLSLFNDSGWDMSKGIKAIWMIRVVLLHFKEEDAWNSLVV